LKWCQTVDTVFLKKGSLAQKHLRCTVALVRYKTIMTNNISYETYGIAHTAGHKKYNPHKKYVVS
jgi:hypothetical protein